MPAVSRNGQVLWYLLQVAPGIGHTKLAKFVYLADIEARKYLGRPVSTFEYVYDKHGPFDSRRFFRALSELKRLDLVTENEIPCGQYRGFEMFPTNRVEFGFSRAEAQVLHYVAETYLSKTARDLCDDVVYKTKPMQGAKVGRPLAMDKVDRDSKDRLGFNVERMLAGEASAASGRTRPLAEVMDELRTGCK